MRFNKLDLNQLVVLDALLSERSVKKAAERLFLTPPATSCALARLREYFDDELLMLVGKTMVLTPRGESLRKPVRDVLLRVQTITTTNPNFDPRTSDRKFVIETSDYAMNVFMGDVIRRVSSEAPLMQFELKLAGPHAHANLDNGDVDILIVPEFFTAPGHPKEQLFEDAWSCVAWTNNDRIRDPFNIEQYLELGHVIIQWDAGRLISADERAAIEHGYTRRHEVLVPNFMVIAQMIVGTQRISTLQTRLARMLSLSTPLKVLPSPMPIPPLIEHLQWSKYRDLDPALVWLRKLMHSVAAEMGPAESKSNTTVVSI